MTAGRAFLLKHLALTRAGVNQEPQRERKFPRAAEVTNSLRPAVFLQDKVVLRQVIDDVTVLVTNRGQHVYQR